MSIFRGIRSSLGALLVLASCQALAQPYAYVPNYGGTDVSVVDGATHTVVATVEVGVNPLGVAPTPDGRLVFITNSNDRSVSVIDTGTAVVVETLSFGVDPQGVVVSPDSSRAYITLENGELMVVDTTTLSVEDSAVVGSSLYQPAISPDGSTLFISSYYQDSVFVVDASSLTVLATLAGINDPRMVLVSNDGAWVYVASDFAGVVVIDAASHTVSRTISGIGQIVGLALSGDGSRLYATDFVGQRLQVIDAAAGTVETSVAIGGQPWGVDITPDGSELFVANRNTNAIDVISTASNSVTTSTPVGTLPLAMGRMFVAVGPAAPGVVIGSGAPKSYAEEIAASPAAPVALVNGGALNLSANLGYSFSVGEVRYARFECDGGLRFGADATASYVGAGDAGLGSINGLGGNAIYFSVTANDNAVVAADRLVIDGGRSITSTNDVTCTYSLYDFPSQAQAGGAAGRVATVSGPYLSFVPSYLLRVRQRGRLVADVESADPSYSEFVSAAPTHDVQLGSLGILDYGTVAELTGEPQPMAPSGLPTTLSDLMHADTALVFAGDFSAADDVYLSGTPDCWDRTLAADDLSALEAVFTLGDRSVDYHTLCFVTGGVAIPVSEYTVALDAVSADPALWNVTGRGPLDLGVITRNGTELQAPLAQVPGNYLSRMVLTNTGSQDRPYEIAVLGETGNVISTANLTGTVPAGGTQVVDLTTVLTGFTAAPRATLNVTIAGPNGQIQGLYQIVNPDSGTISNHVMVRPEVGEEEEEPLPDDV
ncbi:hypothetical protein [Arenimonas sp.]|uniref:YVTN family beta-propeller repeat protein n=1 Tax=Arenimonas sp. TaxID=1872635 RepID=UPI0035B452DD